MGGYTYTPAYYSSFHDTITTLCKSILPFNLRGRHHPPALPDRKLAKRHADALKWQQDSFHRMLHLIGLHKEGMARDAEVAAFRVYLLDTLVAAPAEQEPAVLVRDKLLFLQELLYAKCICDAEYHSFKRPLLQRLAVQGAELECRDIVVARVNAQEPEPKDEEEWSVIDLREGPEHAAPAEKTKNGTPIKGFFGSAPWRAKAAGRKDTPSDENAAAPTKDHDIVDRSSHSILMPESSPLVALKPAKAKRRPFRALFQRGADEDDEENRRVVPGTDKTAAQSAKKQWGFGGLKKWRSGGEDESETPYLAAGERSDQAPANTCGLVSGAKEEGGGHDPKRAKKSAHEDGNAAFDKGMQDDMKKTLPTQLNFFMDHNTKGTEKKWVAFEENDENLHPNLFAEEQTLLMNQENRRVCDGHNPFDDQYKLQDHCDSTIYLNNPFCSPSRN